MSKINFEKSSIPLFHCFHVKIFELCAASANPRGLRCSVESSYVQLLIKSSKVYRRAKINTEVGQHVRRKFPRKTLQNKHEAEEQ